MRANFGLLFVLTIVSINLMKKTTVLNYFGGGRGAQAKVAKAIGVSTAAVSTWPEDLPYSAIGRLAVFQPRAFREITRTKKATGNQTIQPGGKP